MWWKCEPFWPRCSRKLTRGIARRPLTLHPQLLRQSGCIFWRREARQRPPAAPGHLGQRWLADLHGTRTTALTLGIHCPPRNSRRSQGAGWWPATPDRSAHHQCEGGLCQGAPSGKQCTAASRRSGRVVRRGKCAQGVVGGATRRSTSGSSGEACGVRTVGCSGGDGRSGGCHAVGAVGSSAPSDHHRRMAGTARPTPAGHHGPLPRLLGVATPSPVALRGVGDRAPAPHR